MTVTSPTDSLSDGHDLPQARAVPPANQRIGPNSYGIAAAVLFALAAVLVLFQESFATMVGIWLTVDTFRYGLAIVPIVAFLVWRQRSEIFSRPIRPSVLAVMLAAAFSGVWFVGHLAGVQVVMQFAAVAVALASVVALIGTAASRVIAFPLLFAFFAVPIGEFLIQYLIEFTATFSVAALKTIGIPVFRDGTYFYIPTGAYEVAKACSGVKYVIATCVLSTLYSYFLFSSFRKAFSYVAFAFVLSVLANGIRATSVVLLLHYTEMDISAGEDHEFVGWVIYTILIVLLVFAGRRFQDAVPWAYATRDRAAPPTAKGNRPGLVLSVALLLPAIALGPAFVQLTSKPDSLTPDDVGLPPAATAWSVLATRPSHWHPQYAGFAGKAIARYTHEGGAVDVALIRYRSRRQGAELTNASNTVVDTSVWEMRDVRRHEVGLANSLSLTLNQVIVNRESEQRLIWFWSQVGDVHAVSNVRTKLLELSNLAMGATGVSATVVLSTPVVTTEAAASALLGEFLASHYLSLQGCAGAEFLTPDCSIGNITEAF